MQHRLTKFIATICIFIFMVSSSHALDCINEYDDDPEKYERTIFIVLNCIKKAGLKLEIDEFSDYRYHKYLSAYASDAGIESLFYFYATALFDDTEKLYNFLERVWFEEDNRAVRCFAILLMFYGHCDYNKLYKYIYRFNKTERNNRIAEIDFAKKHYKKLHELMSYIIKNLSIAEEKK